MTLKSQIIEAFRLLDFHSLNNLLDDNKSYMDVSKNIFLSKLEEEVKRFPKLSSFNQVVEGTCGSCNKGCPAYRFISSKGEFLDLFIEEIDNGEVADIYVCTNLKTSLKSEEELAIRFSFYEEEKLTFNLTNEYLNNLKKVDTAFSEFNAFALQKHVQILELVNWHNKYKELAKEIKCDSPLLWQPYKAFKWLSDNFYRVSELVEFYNYRIKTEKAVKEYNELLNPNESELLKWFSDYKELFLTFFNKKDDWKKTGLIILDTEPSLLVDCNICISSFLFQELYIDHINLR